MGGTSCFPTSMTMAGLEPAIFASTNAIPLRLVQQGAGQSFGPTGQPDLSALEPYLAAGEGPKIGSDLPTA